MVRVRHYTRRSAKDNILAESRIVAQDQYKIFVESAHGKPLGARQAEARYLLKRGKGNAYVEFDADDAEVFEQMNPRTGRKESYLRGDVDLSARDAKGNDNQ